MLKNTIKSVSDTFIKNTEYSQMLVNTRKK